MRYEYIADIVLEAKTAFSIGSGDKDAIQDAPVQRDWNGMPIIMGTTTAGVLKHLYTDTDTDEIFGKNIEGEDDGNESRLIVSSALLLYNDEGDDLVVEESTVALPPFFEYYKKLPLRHHTAIDDKGVAKDKSKHDQEVVYSGSRFKLRITLKSEKNDDDSEKKFESLLELFYDKRFRIGSKTTAGLGNLKPIEIRYDCFDIIGHDYQDLSSSLNQDSSIFGKSYSKQPDEVLPVGFVDYSLNLSPESFFIFGSGFGSDDDEIDSVFMIEEVVNYEKQKLEKRLLIPASSVKGSLSHRTAYHYNRIKGIFADDTARFPKATDFKKVLGENNQAVKAIFGAQSKIENDQETGHKGRVIIDDSYVEVYDKKVFDHVKIDDFTNAVIRGPLFNEMVASIESFQMTLLVDESMLENETKEALYASLEDLNNGRLTLGGMSSRGHGVFQAVNKGEADA